MWWVQTWHFLFDRTISSPYFGIFCSQKAKIRQKRQTMSKKVFSSHQWRICQKKSIHGSAEKRFVMQEIGKYRKEHNLQAGQILNSKMTLFGTKTSMINVNKLEQSETKTWLIAKSHVSFCWSGGGVCKRENMPTYCITSTQRNIIHWAWVVQRHRIFG